jgi:acetyl-CoA acetyltransferase
MVAQDLLVERPVQPVARGGHQLRAKSDTNVDGAHIPREQQDRYAAESFRRAEAAQNNGWLDDEIAPIACSRRPPGCAGPPR